MSEFQGTVFIVSDGDQEALKKTVGSLETARKNKIVQVRTLEVRKGASVWKEYEAALKKTVTPYVMFVSAGDRFGEQAPKEALAWFETVRSETDVVMLHCSYLETDFPEADPEAVNRLYSLDVEDEVLQVPPYFEGVILRTETARELQFDESHGYETWEEWIYRLLDRKRTIGYLPNTMLLVGHASKSQPSEYRRNRNADWYLGTARDHWFALRDFYKEKYGQLPLYIQYLLLYEIKTRFFANGNQSNKRALTDEQVQEFFGLCGEILQDIDDAFMIPEPGVVRETTISHAMFQQLLNMKYHGQAEVKYMLDRSNPQGESKTRFPMHAIINGNWIHRAIHPNIYLDVANYEKGVLILDFSCPRFLYDSDVHIKAVMGGKRMICTPTVRYADTSYFGILAYRAHTFRVELSHGRFKDEINLFRFVAEYEDFNTPVPITSRRFTARISPKIENSFWCFGSFMLTYENVGPRRKLQITRIDRKIRMQREKEFIKQLWDAGGFEKEMAKQRLLYWMAFPFYHKKNIWLTFDKMYKGGDCGEYFYKYMVSRKKDTNVVPVYVINRDSPDRKRLRKEGYHPVVHGSLKHRLLYLHAKMVFATHAGLYNFNGITDEEIPYLADLFRSDAACIQHGLTVQDLAFNANRAYNNNKRYYCASKYEVENLLQPIYGYDDPSVIRLTGIPRYDGLKNDDRHQILIAPTWRSYFALQATDRFNSRPYYAGFKDTVYYRVYEELLSDKKLLETAKKTGYRLIFVVHPNIAAQTVDFTKRKGVEIVSALDINYEQVLVQSSLMVTDYSGVQFDFAYMRKPIVYYHTPLLPPHYKEGGFFYDTQGFGEICREQRELVDTLCGYMESGCRIQPFYEAREDDFFAFRDHENCRRIFEDALEYQKSKLT